MKTARNRQEICIIFSRYPRPGVSKTRLVPHLGPEAAADLQRRMTEAVVEQAMALEKVDVELAMAEATDDEVAAWLGPDIYWQPQVGEDLGDRMKYAFAQAFERGYQRVVIVGADCPEVDSRLLSQAFQKLREDEIVLGPTLDGGYYLIGLSQTHPELFSNISWGSDKVLEQTRVIARKKKIEPALLAKLRDVDLPQDLEHLPPFLQGQMP